jgi:hypothetical protein
MDEKKKRKEKDIKSVLAAKAVQNRGNKSPGRRHSSGSDFASFERGGGRREAILIPPPTTAPPGERGRGKNAARGRPAKDSFVPKKPKPGGHPGTSGPTGTSGGGVMVPKEPKFVDPNLDNLISKVKEFKQYRETMATSGERSSSFSNGKEGTSVEDSTTGGPKLNMGTVLHDDFARKHILAEVKASPPASPLSVAVPTVPSDPIESILAGKPVAVVESVKKDEVLESSVETEVSTMKEEEDGEKGPVSKAMPNLSAWFKAFGQPKKKVCPVATVKPTTPIKDAAPWAYGKFEKEKNAANSSAASSGGNPGGVKDAKKSPVVSQTQQQPPPPVQPPMASPQPATDRSPMYASSESEVQSPQTPQYGPGGWASEPSPARDGPQRSPHVGSLGGSQHPSFGIPPGGASLASKSPAQEPLKVRVEWSVYVL